jgi:hypothetical protein
MSAGLIDADLGGSVYKKRVLMPGRGKRGGARTILGSNFRDRWFVLFGFEKSDRVTIGARELAALQKIASVLIGLETTLLDHSVTERELKEICHEENPPAN